jgi:hypothetical protein
VIARLNVSVASRLVRWQTALGDLGRGLDHEHPRALGAVGLSDRDAEGLDQARPCGAGLGTGREVDEEVGCRRSAVIGRYQAIRVLGYSFRALIVARFAKQSTMKRRSSDAGLQA